MRLLETRQAISLLYPAFMREICYWLLTSPDGGQVMRMALGSDRTRRLVGAIHSLRDRFTDHARPGISGLELARQIADRWPDLEVVLTTGFSHVLAEESGHNFALLRKPYSVQGLIGIL